VSDRDAQLFLKQITIAALEGRATDGADLTNYAPAVPLPLQARSLISRIPGYLAIPELIAQSVQLQNKPAEISRRRRLVLLAGCVAPAVLVGFFFTLVLVMAIRVTATGYSAYHGSTPYPEFDEIVALKTGLMKLQSLKRSEINDGTGQAIEVYIAAHFRNQVTDPSIWNKDVFKSAFTPAERQMAERIVAAHETVSESELSAATKRVKPFGVIIADRKAAATRMSSIGSQKMKLTTMGAITLAVVWSLLVGLPALIAAVLFRGGLILHGLGLAIVTKNGAPASRWRILWRACIVWSPVLGLTVATILVPAASRAAASRGTGQWLGVTIGIAAGLAFLLFTAAAVWSLWRPQRGIQDWLAGTCMVPR
jgi:hypothetical protein